MRFDSASSEPQRSLPKVMVPSASGLTRNPERPRVVYSFNCILRVLSYNRDCVFDDCGTGRMRQANCGAELLVVTRTAGSRWGRTSPRAPPEPYRTECRQS